MIYIALTFLMMLNWFNGLRTVMGKLQFLPMQWPCFSQLVVPIPLPNIPYMLKKLPKISFLGLRLKLLLGIHLVLSCLISLLEIRSRQLVVLMNIWPATLKFIPFEIPTEPKVIQVSEQESGKAMQQLLGASSSLETP